MVETDVGDDGKHWGDDVGAVESAAQSYLDYGVIYPLLGKVLQCHGSGQFEEGWMEGFEEASILLYEVDDILLRNAFAVNSDALSEIYEMRGGVETYLVSLTLQDGGDGMRAGTLAIGSGNMDGLVLAMGMSEVFVQGMGGLKAWLVCFGSNLFEHWGAVKKVFCCLLIIHELYINV